MVGQKAIVRTLLNQLISDKLSHAYLFCGTRGTGKTSAAKILARAVNCLNPHEGEPCNECEVCRDILSDTGVNVIEIDAASNNGVDNIRDIREEVKYPPVGCAYRVYIVDEVHMLSAGAFNALLKTLEEPPRHVIFILATTDPQKLPPTILSRCQRYDFKRITSSDMADVMGGYAEKLSIGISPEALKYIADISDGAMRDALSLLDQASVYYTGEKITLPMVLDLVGAADPTLLFDFTEALNEGRTAAALDVINKISSDGKDIYQFAQDCVQHFRNLIVADVIKNPSQSLDFSAEYIERLRNTGKKISSQTLLEYINTFAALLSQMRYARNPRILFEVAVVKLCGVKLCGVKLCGVNDIYNDGVAPNAVPAGLKSETVSLLESRLEQLEQKLAELIMNFPVRQAAVSTNSNAAGGVQPPPRVKAVPDDIQNVLRHWMEFINCFDNATKALLCRCKPGYLDGGALHIICPDPASRDWLMSKQNHIVNNLVQNYHKEFEVRFSLSDDYDAEHRRLYGKMDTFEELQSKLNIKIEEW
jgi:DNA polymerase-3 subunit gamma/tau